MKKKESQYQISRINTKVMNYNVYVMNKSEKLGYMSLLMIAGGAVGLVFYGGLFKSEGTATMMTTISNLVVFILGGILANHFFMPNVVRSLKVKRINQLKKQFCDFATALTNALASGMNMGDSLMASYEDLRTQYSEDAFIVQEVKEILSGVQNNVPVELMLEDFGVRSGTDDIVNFGTVFSLCYRTGGDIKSIVRRTTEIISEKVMISSEIETVITSNKLQMNIMNVLPIIIIVLMKAMSADFANGFTSGVGLVGITICAALTLGAYRLGQKITDIKG